MVLVGLDPQLTLAIPRPWFEANSPNLELSASIVPGNPVDAHPDGARFIAVRQTGPPVPPSLLFVENW